MNYYRVCGEEEESANCNELNANEFDGRVERSASEQIEVDTGFARLFGITPPDLQSLSCSLLFTPIFMG